MDLRPDVRPASSSPRPAPHVPRRGHARANLLPAMPRPDAAARARRQRRSPESLSKRFERPLLVLAGLWTLLWAVEPFSGSQAGRWLDAAAALIWGAFAGELIACLAVARPRAAYLRRHWAEIGFVAVPGLRLLRAVALIGSSPITPEVRLARRLSAVGIVSVVLTVVAARLMFDFGDVRPFATAMHDATLGVVGGQTFANEDGLAQAVEVVLVAFHTIVIAALAGCIGAFFLRKSQDTRSES